MLSFGTKCGYTNAQRMTFFVSLTHFSLEKKNLKIWDLLQ